MNYRPVWATLKQDKLAYFYEETILIPKGTIVDLGQLTSVAFCGNAMIFYNLEEFDDLFEELK